VNDSLLYSSHYLATFAVVTITAVVLAFVFDNRDLGFAAAILGLYLLHLLSLRFILRGQQEQWRTLRQMETSLGELARAELGAGPGPVRAADADGRDRTEGGRGEPSGEDPLLKRHFALGTVAVIRKVLNPAQVATVLREQRGRLGERFGEVALDLGMLTEEELESLLRAQKEGVFRQSEIRMARERLERYQSGQASSAASLRRAAR